MKGVFALLLFYRFSRYPLPDRTIGRTLASKKDWGWETEKKMKAKKKRRNNFRGGGGNKYLKNVRFFSAGCFSPLTIFFLDFRVVSVSLSLYLLSPSSSCMRRLYYNGKRCRSPADLATSFAETDATWTSFFFLFGCSSVFIFHSFSFYFVLSFSLSLFGFPLLISQWKPSSWKPPPWDYPSRSHIRSRCFFFLFFYLLWLLAVLLIRASPTKPTSPCCCAIIHRRAAATRKASARFVHPRCSWSHFR